MSMCSVLKGINSSCLFYVTLSSDQAAVAIDSFNMQNYGNMAVFSRVKHSRTLQINM